MKKHVFTFMAFFVICMSSLALFSCNDNDDDKKIDDEILIGKWVLIEYTYESENGSYKDEYPIYEEEDVIVFKKSGVCHNYCYIKSLDDYDWNDYGEWESINNSSIKLLFYGEGEQIVTILNLTETILSFECNVIDEDDGTFSKYEMTYQRID